MSILKISAIFILLLGIIVGAFYWYFNYSQNEINTLEQNMAKLTEAVQIQQQAAQDQLTFEKQQNLNLATLQAQLQDANKVRTDLENEFLNTDINIQARKNAQALEDKMNKETAAALKALEDITIVPTTKK